MPDSFFRRLQSIADRAGINRDMLEDLGAVAALTDEQLADLHRRFNEVTGFLDLKKLAGVVNQTVTDKRVAVAVQRVLRNLAPEDVDVLVQSLEKNAKAIEDFPLDGEALKKLRHVLPKLLIDIPALQRFEKAEHLASLTGHQLDAVDLICDLRPIFDEGRAKIEGIMPYTRLHVSVTGDDGFPRTFEAELTAQQVNELAEKAVKAKQKLKVLRSQTNIWLPEGLPDLPLTRVPHNGGA